MDDSYNDPATQWARFGQVDALILIVNKYLKIYDDLVLSGDLNVIGSEGDKKPRHRIPNGLSRQEWEAHDKDKQLQLLREVATETNVEMSKLVKKISRDFEVQEAFCGDLKGTDRVVEKRDNDYDGDVLRVIDVVRCSVVFVLSSLVQGKEIVDAFRRGGRYHHSWRLVRVKDGFEKPDNYTVGGYRDIKLNVRCKRTGHIVEIQLHLEPFVKLKKNGGHEHYKVARTFKVDGITNAVQVLNGDLYWEIAQEGENALKNADTVEERIRILRQLGDLYCAMWCHGSQGVTRFHEALRLCDEHFEEDNVLTCDVLTGLTYCVSEMQRHWDREDMRSHDETYRTMDLIPWIDRAIESAKRLLGERHPFTMKAMRVKADVLVERDELGEAEGLYRFVFKEQQAVLGHQHPDVAETMNNYGDLLTNVDDDDVESIAAGVGMYLDALEGVLPRLGSDNVTSRMLYANLCATFDDNPSLFEEYPELKNRFDAFKEDTSLNESESEYSGTDSESSSGSESESSSGSDSESD